MNQTFWKVCFDFLCREYRNLGTTEVLQQEGPDLA